MKQEIKRGLVILGAALTLAVPVGLMTGQSVFAGHGKGHHPRLEKSLHELQETIGYLEKAPDKFGGHKAKAIAACKTAMAELKEALAHADK